MSFKISKNKIHVYSASREITEPGALWNQGQLLILLLISHRGAMPPRCFCRADWLSGMPAQLTAVMDGAPAPAPPGCQAAQKSLIHMWNSTILCASTEHTFFLPLLLHEETSTTSKACFGLQICSYLFLQSRKPSNCTAGSQWHGQNLTCRLDPLLYARLDALPHP